MQTYRAILPYVSPTYAAAYLLPKNAQRYNDEIVEIWFRRLGDGSAGRWVERMVAYLAWPALSVLAMSCDLLIFCGFVMWLIATHAVALFYLCAVLAASRLVKDTWKDKSSRSTRIWIVSVIAGQGKVMLVRENLGHS